MQSNCRQNANECTFFLVEFQFGSISSRLLSLEVRSYQKKIIANENTRTLIT
jgi:hypothetical protein